MKKAWVLSYPLSAQRRLWSDWADAQADLSLRWAHIHFVGFVVSWLICHRWTFQSCNRRYSAFCLDILYLSYDRKKLIFRDSANCHPWDSYRQSQPYDRAILLVVLFVVGTRFLATSKKLITKKNEHANMSFHRFHRHFNHATAHD